MKFVVFGKGDVTLIMEAMNSIRKNIFTND